MVCYPSWHDALEPAQVLAGLVRYPPDNPVYIYSTQTWTVLHEVLALLLYAGLPERVLALMLSGVTGMVSLQALGIVVLALSGNVRLAILAPAFILGTHAASGGVTYPVVLMGFQWSYGIIGLSYLLLSAALIGAGQPRWGALLLGFEPAVHLTLGAWGIVVVAIAIAIDHRGTVGRSVRRGAWPWFLVGAASAAVCAVVHGLLIDPLPARHYVSSFVEHWDGHRQPFSLVEGSILAAGFSAGLSLLWLWRFRHDIPEHARALLRILVIAAVLGGTLSASYWTIPADVPNVIPSLMPSRLLNLNLMAFMALIIGLSARYGHRLGVQANLTALIAVVLVLSAWARLREDDTARVFVPWVSMGVAGSTLALLVEFRRDRLGRHGPGLWWLTWLKRTTTGGMALALLGILVVGVGGFSGTVQQEFLDRANSPLFATAAGRPGMLLTSSDVHLVQLRTRRPLLLDGGAIDALIYVPAAEPATDRILQRVYGTDLRTLKQEHQGSLDTDTARVLWQARTLAEWQDIAREFGVTDILTYAGWQLRLPVVATSADFTLYEIPLGH